MIRSSNINKMKPDDLYQIIKAGEITGSLNIHVSGTLGREEIFFCGGGYRYIVETHLPDFSFPVFTSHLSVQEQGDNPQHLVSKDWRGPIMAARGHVKLVDIVEEIVREEKRFHSQDSMNRYIREELEAFEVQRNIAEMTTSLNHDFPRMLIAYAKRALFGPKQYPPELQPEY